MTDHLKQRHGKIESYADLRKRLDFCGNDMPVKTGVEIEFHIQDMRKPDDAPSMASDSRVLELKDALRQRQENVDDEIAAHMLELKTEAFTLAELPTLIERIRQTRANLVTASENLELKPSPFATLADMDLTQALGNLIAPTAANPERGARPRTMMATLKNAGLSHLMPYPLLNTSVQTSISAQDPDHMFRAARQHFFLLPFYMVALNGRPPSFNPHTGEKTDIHSGLEARRLLRDRGLIPNAFYRATDGDSFMRHYFEEVYKRPMLCHTDLSDQFHMASRHRTESMETLHANGLNTYSNYSLSESFDWFAGKRKTVPGTNFVRFECRDIDSSLHNDVTFTVISSLLNMDADCSADVDRLLADYDYGTDTPAGYVMLELDLKRAYRDARSHMDIPYGTGRMDEFAREFYKTIEPYARKHGVINDLAAFDLICQTGATEARMIDRICRTKEDVVRLQKNTSYEQLSRGISFGMLYDMG